MDLLLTVEQVELIRRLKRTGITPDRVVEAFRQIERFECELEIWSSRLQLRQREEAVRQLQFIQRFSSLTGHGATSTNESLHHLFSATGNGTQNDEAQTGTSRRTAIDSPLSNIVGGTRAMEILRTLLGVSHGQSDARSERAREQPGGVVSPDGKTPNSLHTVQGLIPASMLHSMTVPVASNASSWALPGHGPNAKFPPNSSPAGSGNSTAHSTALEPAVLKDLGVSLMNQRLLRIDAIAPGGPNFDRTLFTSPPLSSGGNHSTSAVHGSPPSSVCSTRSGLSTGNENTAANGVGEQPGSKANSSRPIRSQRTPMKEITTLDDPHELEEFMLQGEEACIADMRQFIQQFSLRQTTVAMMTGVSQPYISKLLNGNHRELSLRCRKNIYSWYLNCRRHPEKLVTFVQDPATRLETNGETGELIPQRRERYVFRPALIRILERYFADSPFPDTPKRVLIANACNQALLREKGVVQLAAKEIVTPQVIANWFANKRKEIRRKSNHETEHLDALTAGEQRTTLEAPPSSLLNGDMDVDCSCEATAIAAHGVVSIAPLKSAQLGGVKMEGEDIDMNHNHPEPSKTLSSYLKSPSQCISPGHSNEHRSYGNRSSNPPPLGGPASPSRTEHSHSRYAD